MKKILILQTKSNSFGGIWFVDKALGDEFIKKGYKVKLIGIRKNHPGIDIKNDSFDIQTINDLDEWEITHRRDIINSIKKFKFIRTLIKYVNDNKKLNHDYKICMEEIKKYNPDFIIASHYQVLDAIPQEYLKKVVHVQHSSIEFMLSDKKNVKTLKKYQNKILKLIWLSNTIKKQAQELGFENSECIYNPVRFSTEHQANVIRNKKIVVISRIDQEKRIDLMIKIVNDIFQNKKYKDWIFEIYGIGEFNNESKEILKSSKQIRFMGVTYDPLPILLNSSITLNTSLFEGYPLSVIEGFTCGLPVVSFNFGENAKEQIIDKFNGFLVKMNDIKMFKEKLELLMTDKKTLKVLSDNSKEFSKKFKSDIIIKEWIKLIDS